MLLALRTNRYLDLAAVTQQNGHPCHEVVFVAGDIFYIVGVIGVDAFAHREGHSRQCLVGYEREVLIVHYNLAGAKVENGTPRGHNAKFLCHDIVEFNYFGFYSLQR